MSSNFAEFDKVIKKFAKEIGEKVKDVTKKSSFRIYREITAKTAVGNPSTWQDPTPPYEGYVGGRLRASLTIKEGSPDLTVAPPNTTTIPEPKLGKIKDNPTIYIANNLPYANRVLMKAWSTQTPKNMAENAVLREYKKLESGSGV